MKKLYLIIMFIIGGIGGYLVRPSIDKLLKSHKEQTSSEEVENFMKCLEGNE